MAKKPVTGFLTPEANKKHHTSFEERCYHLYIYKEKSCFHHLLIHNKKTKSEVIIYIILLRFICVIKFRRRKKIHHFYTKKKTLNLGPFMLKIRKHKAREPLAVTDYNFTILVNFF